MKCEYKYKILGNNDETKRQTLEREIIQNNGFVEVY